MPRRERRRRRGPLLALAEAQDISALFPRVRPRDDVLDAFAERVARELEPDDPRVPPDRVEEGVALLDERERRRIVDDWTRKYPDRWSSLCGAAGDIALTERAVVASAVRGAISERRPPHRRLLSLLDAMPTPMSACGVLGVVLAPPLVWDRDDAILLADAAGSPEDPQRFLALAHRLGNGRVEEWHVGRVRELAGRLGDELPIDGLPRASALLEAGCLETGEDEDAAVGLAGFLLASYALAIAMGKVGR
jgi:hypothetical protein